MKLVCPREELSRALQTVLRSVGARAGIPALSGVLLELDDDGLLLTTTDLELTTRAHVAVSGASGRVVIPAAGQQITSDEVRALRDADQR
jgi:DNA polymerase III subunit beta